MTITSQAVVKRCRLALCGLTAVLLLLAFIRHPIPAPAQSAVSLSLPGQEDLTFWANHNGLIEIDFEGEVGFGDLARILMRRRANAARLRAHRDRFVFTTRDAAVLGTPDLLVAEIQAGALRWVSRPARFTIAAGRAANLPLAVANRQAGAVPITIHHEGRTIAARIAPASTACFLLKVKEPSAGPASRRISIATAGAGAIHTEIGLDVRPLVSLRVAIRDENGQPAPARIYLTGADGLGYAPPGTVHRFTAMSAESCFHARGEFEIQLPAGETILEAVRGTEYNLTRRVVELQPGKARRIELRLNRWRHAARQGWYSADSHIHANYTAEHHQVITAADIRLQTLAEDLNVANLMVANSGGAFIHDRAFFEGRPHELSQPGYILYWNEEFRNAALYGHMSFFGLKTLIEPIYTGFRDTPHWEDYPPNATQAAAAHAQGGAVTYVHPGYQPTLDGASARELPVDAALGLVDAMDVFSNNPEDVAVELWYRLLNTGLRVAVSAGSDTFNNVADHYTMGAHRVYAKVDGALDYGRWIEAYRQGRSFATNGPVIEVSVNGRGPGEEIRLPPDRLVVDVRAEVFSAVPLEKLEIVINGQVAASGPPGTLRKRIRLEGSSWVAARARGPWHRLILNDAYAFAHTSPVYVRAGDRPIHSSADARFWLQWIDQLIARTESRGRFASEDRKREVVALFRKAREFYQRMVAAAPSPAESRLKVAHQRVQVAE